MVHVVNAAVDYKAVEDEKAIGGLRNPHLSIKELKGDLTTVDKLCKLMMNT